VRGGGSSGGGSEEGWEVGGGGVKVRYRQEGWGKRGLVRAGADAGGMSGCGGVDRGSRGGDGGWPMGNKTT